MKHLMLDMETVGCNPGCTVLGVGAVLFDLDTGDIGKKFSVSIRKESCAEIGLIDETPSLEWWMLQDANARERAWSGNTHVRLAMHLFNQFCLTLHLDEIHVWANSPKFDIPILEEALKRCGHRYLFNTFLERDFRTLSALAPNIRKEIPFDGIKHDPLHDSIHQALCASYIWNMCSRVDQHLKPVFV